MRTFEDWEKERARTRIYPEPCPSRESEVDLDKARYIVDGREFRFVSHGPSSYVDLSRTEEGIEYLLEPGSEDCIDTGIFEDIRNAVSSVNQRGRFRISKLWVRSSNHPYDEGCQISPILGCPQVSYVTLKQLDEEERKEYLEKALCHEAGHLSGNQKSDEFKELWKKAHELGILDWFKDSNFFRFKNKVSERSGHTEENPAELYASAYMISQLVRPEFDKRFYSVANEQQRKIIDEIFSFVDGVRK